VHEKVALNAASAMRGRGGWELWGLSGGMASERKKPAHHTPALDPIQASARGCAH